MKHTLIIILMIISAFSVSARQITDANVFGHVTCEGKHIPYVNVFIKGTTIGTATDKSGHFKIVNAPLGKHILVVRAVGYKTQEKEVTFEANKLLEINFELEIDALHLESVVITGDRNEINRRESPVVVTSLTQDFLKNTESTTLLEGLNFCTGLRTESNCQNCGFSQVRINGLEGPYSQILINGRSIFNGLAGVYGLEMIPTSMIDRIEVVKGGGSALYGGNAVAGTVNLILKEPLENSAEVGMTGGMTLVGDAEPMFDYNVNATVNALSEDRKTGITLFAFNRKRTSFDANDDSYSEIAELDNTTFGTTIYHRFNEKNKLSADFFFISEKRRGGDSLNLPYHVADIAEAIEHKIASGGLTYEHIVNKNSILSVYAAAQRIKRNTYYGAEQSLADYGVTKSTTYNLGATYKINKKKSHLVSGLEHHGETLNDVKCGYYDYENAVIAGDSIVSVPYEESTTIAYQTINTSGAFAQYDYKFNKIKVAAGLRYDYYIVNDKESESKTSNGVLCPRANILYSITKDLELRLNYSSGYRAPQIFDEDLHIESSGARQIVHENSDDLEQENSYSLMGSLDYHKKINKLHFEILAEGFYTALTNPFAIEYGDPDANGSVVYTRTNSESGAFVFGTNLELTMVFSRNMKMKLGYTYQISEYEEAQEFDETNFLRTPNHYGFISYNWNFLDNSAISITGDYTGKMLIAYFGDSDEGRLVETDPFFDLSFKFTQNIKTRNHNVELSAGIKNILNSYQNDFDSGVDRDPGYVYGPTLPRYIYAGLKLKI